MSWERDLFAFLDDLEGQAQAAFEVEREAEVADRAHAEYAAVTLESRLAASTGRRVCFELTMLGRVDGELTRVGEGWCLLTGRGQDWIVPVRHVIGVQGVSERAIPEVARSPVQRLGLRSALRRIAEADEPTHLHLLDGTRRDVRVVRAGADFLEIQSAAGTLALVAYAAVVALQSREPD